MEVPDVTGQTTSESRYRSVTETDLNYGELKMMFNDGVQMRLSEMIGTRFKFEQLRRDLVNVNTSVWRFALEGRALRVRHFGCGRRKVRLDAIVDCEFFKFWNPFL